MNMLREVAQPRAVITARMKVCARVDPSMSTASKGVDARHNLHILMGGVPKEGGRASPCDSALAS